MRNFIWDEGRVTRTTLDVGRTNTADVDGDDGFEYNGYKISQPSSEHQNVAALGAGIMLLLLINALRLHTRPCTRIQPHYQIPALLKYINGVHSKP